MKTAFGDCIGKVGTMITVVQIGTGAKRINALALIQGLGRSKSNSAIDHGAARGQFDR